METTMTTDKNNSCCPGARGLAAASQFATLTRPDACRRGRIPAPGSKNAARLRGVEKKLFSQVVQVVSS